MDRWIDRSPTSLHILTPSNATRPLSLHTLWILLGSLGTSSAKPSDQRPCAPPLMSPFCFRPFWCSIQRVAFNSSTSYNWYLCYWLMSNWTLYPINWCVFQGKFFSFIFNVEATLSHSRCAGSQAAQELRRSRELITLWQLLQPQLWHINRCHVNTGCQTHSGQWSPVRQHAAIQLRINYIILFCKEQV